MASSADTLNTIEAFIQRVGQTKSASAPAPPANGTVKAADGSKPLSEAGGYQGETSHPVKKVDDRLEKAPEGERFKENTKDVKEDQGAASIEGKPDAKAASVNGLVSQFAKSNPFLQGLDKAGCVGNCAKCGNHCSKCSCKKASEGGGLQSPGSAADDAEPSELSPQPTGKDVPDTKGGKDDKKDGDRGGTSHPASTENNQLDGHKYAGDDGLAKMAADLTSLGNSLLNNIAVLADDMGQSKTAADAQRVSGQPVQQPKRAQAIELDPQVQAELGYELAGLVSGNFDKKAADSLVQRALEDIIWTGQQRAIKVAAYLEAVTAEAEAQRKAAAEVPPPVDPSMAGPQGGPVGGAEGGMGGGGPPGAGGGPGGGGPDDDALMSSLGAMPPGGDGGAPGGGPGGPGGGGDPHAQEAMMLARLMEQMGITEEDIQQAIAAEAGGGPGGGGEPPLGGGAGPAGAGPSEQMAPGTGKEAADKIAEAKRGEYQAGMRAYVSELIARSRAARRAG